MAPMIRKIFRLLLLLGFFRSSEEVAVRVIRGAGIRDEDGSITCVIDPPGETVYQVDWEFIRSDGTNVGPVYSFFPPSNTRSPQGNLVNRSSYEHNATAGESTLIIHQFANTDQGNYTCTMVVPATLTDRNEMIIYSRPGLDVTTYPPSSDNIMKVKNGTNVTLSAVSNCSKPPLELEWSKPGPQNNPRPCDTTSFPGYGIIESSLIYQATANTSITLTARHPTFLKDQSTTYVIAVESDMDGKQPPMD